MTDYDTVEEIMGTFTVRIDVGDSEGRGYETVDALVDTGATYLTVPGPILESLGVEVRERKRFIMADERIPEYDLGIASLRLDDRSYPVLTVFGEPGAGALLGAVALETFGLGVDPIRQRLVPVDGLLKPSLSG